MLSLASLCLLPLPISASSMPKADQHSHSLSIGTAPSLALDFNVSPDLSIGLSGAMPLYGKAYGFIRYDLHSTYLLLKQDTLFVRGLVGVFGDVNLPFGNQSQASPFGLETGISLAYDINQWFTARLNIVAGINFPKANLTGLFAPAGGIEVAFRPFEQFEATLGLNGNGDILAIRYLF